MCEWERKRDKDRKRRERERDKEREWERGKEIDKLGTNNQHSIFQHISFGSGYTYR